MRLPHSWQSSPSASSSSTPYWPWPSLAPTSMATWWRVPASRSSVVDVRMFRLRYTERYRFPFTGDSLHEVGPWLHQLGDYFVQQVRQRDPTARPNIGGYGPDDVVQHRPACSDTRPLRGCGSSQRRWRLVRHQPGS